MRTPILIVTERTILRELTPDDAADFYRLNQDPEVLRYTGDLPFQHQDAARAFLEDYDQYQKFGVGRLAVIHKLDNQFMGWCGLKYSPDIDEYDIGFRFFRKYWYKDYATETARSCIDCGFGILQLKNITGRAMNNNKASIRVLEKLGMSLKKSFDFDGQSGVIYQISKDEWQRLP